MVLSPEICLNTAPYAAKQHRELNKNSFTEQKQIILKSQKGVNNDPSVHLQLTRNAGSVIIA